MTTNNAYWVDNLAPTKPDAENIQREAGRLALRHAIHGENDLQLFWHILIVCKIEPMQHEVKFANISELEKINIAYKTIRKNNN